MKKINLLMSVLSVEIEMQAEIFGPAYLYHAWPYPGFFCTLHDKTYTVNS